MRVVLDTLHNIIEGFDHLTNSAYTNYIDDRLQNGQQLYYKQNLPRLKKCDPTVYLIFLRQFSLEVHHQTLTRQFD